jgi:peptide/nickel transport system ATP-binding protein
MSFNCKELKIYEKDKKLVDISFSFNKKFALIGESGSGKSLSLKAIMNLLPPNLKSKIDLDGFEPKRGENIAFVPQNPFTTLSPMTKIKNQLFVSKSRVFELFELVGLNKELLNKFPSQLSCGQLQRVVIAIALSHKPEILLLDEPTTALDFDTKMRIIEVLNEIQSSFKLKLLLVTHDIQASELLCDEMAIIKEGRIVESGKTSEIISNPKEEYTKILIESNFSNRKRRE